MSRSFAERAFGDAAKALQTEHGSRAQYERMNARGPAEDVLGDFETTFLQQRDSFYMATVTAGGWPYVQHRGGPKGFIKVIDPKTIAFADLSGNKQYITTGNLATDDRVALILVDYRRQARMKVLGRVEVIEGEDAFPWIDKLIAPPDGRIERVFVVHIEAFDWNCPQHITPRYTLDELEEQFKPVREHIRKLEEENAELRRRLETKAP